MSLPPALLTAILGCLLHDIGKPVQRARLGYQGTHSAIGRAFLKRVWLRDERNPAEFAGSTGEDEVPVSGRAVLDAVSYHHGAALQHAADAGRLAADAPAYIAYIADNIAAGADRRKLDSDAAEDRPDWQPKTPLGSVYNHLFDRVGQSVYEPEMLDDREPINFPKPAGRDFDAAHYTAIHERLKTCLETFDLSEEFLNSLLNTLEATLAYVPSSTDASEAVDISLFDHLKLTAAFGACIWHRLAEAAQTDYKGTLFDQTDAFYAQPAFLLASFDLSGIQDFIYTIHSDGAAKMLRARSFYLEMLCEHLVDELLERLQLSRANLMYSGGGHAYLLLPNTQSARDGLAQFERDANAWLLEHFQTSVFLAAGCQEFSARDVMRPSDPQTTEAHSKRYAGLYRSVSEQISARKLARYSAGELRRLNGAFHAGERECQVCHRVDGTVASHDGRTVCSLCAALLKASPAIQGEPFIIASAEGDLPLPFGKALQFTNRQRAAELAGPGARIYAKNKFYVGPEQGVHLWVGDYVAEKELSRYARAAAGIPRLGVVRLDVDSLGTAFTTGFSAQQNGQFNTISRASSFSRSLSLFFRQHINYVLEQPRYRGLVREGRGRRQITIIYSGGDDVFAVGAWHDVIEFAVELRDAFAAYTDGKLTLSGGLGLYPDKYPIAVMARETGDLEAAAKNHPGKDAVALFTPDAVFGWDELRDGVIKEKLGLLDQFFAGQDERGKAFMYKLLQLLRERDDQISLARWVYFLSRLEPRDPAAKEKFRSFANQLHQWFQRADDARQLIAALELYVYKTRDKTRESGDQ